MTSYSKRLREHLADYKRNRLGVDENGVWRRTGEAYPHILPEGLRRLNIIETIRTEFWASFADMGVKLHSDFHHLNSSQAMCFNLFFPFMDPPIGRPDEFLRTLRIAPARVEEWSFEYVEDAAEATSFDFRLRLADGQEAVFEVKLTEGEFGAALDDKTHRQKLNSIYRNRLDALVVEEALRREFFFANYQLLRNVAFLAADPKRLVYFIVPKGNGQLAPGIERLKAVLRPEASPRVRVVYIDEFVPALSRTLGPDKSDLSTHLSLFSEKYLSAH